MTKIDNVLEVKDLTMHYRTRKGPVYAVDDVSFSLGRGESLGLVGESGCGKTSIAISLLKLLP
ncbi:MAG: ATP-binding cassette domain-containing protein, partial [Anaerolineales bacterium]